MSLPLDPFGRTSLPADSVAKLRARVQLQAEIKRFELVAQRLATSTDPDEEAIGCRMLAWLKDGGDLQKKLQLRGPRGRHRPPHRDEDKRQPTR